MALNFVIVVLCNNKIIHGCLDIEISLVINSVSICTKIELNIVSPSRHALSSFYIANYATEEHTCQVIGYFSFLV